MNYRVHCGAAFGRELVVRSSISDFQGHLSPEFALHSSLVFRAYLDFHDSSQTLLTVSPALC